MLSIQNTVIVNWPFAGSLESLKMSPSDPKSWKLVPSGKQTIFISKNEQPGKWRWQTSEWRNDIKPFVENGNKSFQEKWDKMFWKVHLIFGEAQNLTFGSEITHFEWSEPTSPSNQQSVGDDLCLYLQWAEGGPSVLTFFQFPMLPFKTTINPPPKTTECPLKRGQIIFQPLSSKFHVKLWGSIDKNHWRNRHFASKVVVFLPQPCLLLPPFFREFSPDNSKVLLRLATPQDIAWNGRENPPRKRTTRNCRKFPHGSNRKYIDSFMVDFPMSNVSFFLGVLYPFG